MKVLRSFAEAGRTLTLRQQGEHLELVMGGGSGLSASTQRDVILLSSAALQTERTFGQLAASTDASPPRVVVGGLGFGSTLRGVLDVVGEDAVVLVVEKMGAVIDLARTDAAHLVGDALDDPRVQLVHGDVADVIERESGLSAIVLDVDNGPGWASFRSNARLYADAALKRARQALRGGGLYAVWSGYPADAFVATLRRAGFQPRVIPLDEDGVVRARAYVGTAPA